MSICLYNLARYVPSRTTTAVDILQQEGAASLAKETSRFLMDRTPLRDRYRYYLSQTEVTRRMDAEEGLEDILDTVLDIKPGYPPYQIHTIQLRDEIRALSNLVKEEQPRSVLEIGTAKGGSLYVWSRYLDDLDTIISVDLPGGGFGGGYDERKTRIFEKFAASTEMDFIRDDSHRTSTYEKVAELVDDGIDFLFIDGDHTYDGVKQDFEMYRELVSEGGIIALHDIATHPDDREVVERRRRDVNDIEDRHLSWGESYPDCNVDQLWTEIVEEYETREIISHPKQTWAGIGVIRV
jgi:predicted O-methyltransferase YrrM